MDPDDNQESAKDPRSPARIAFDNFRGIFKLGAPKAGSAKREVNGNQKRARYRRAVSCFKPSTSRIK